MKIMLDKHAKMPTRAHSTDAGLDLYNIGIRTIIFPGMSDDFDTGVHVELPAGTYGRIEGKSGLNFNHDVICAGGTIDQGYTGRIHVKLYNLGRDMCVIEPYQKIAQLVIVPCLQPGLEVVDRLEDTERGENGFGSTGL